MFRITVLGGFSLERDGTRVEGLGPRRSALLAALAVAGVRGLSRDRLLLYLWPDSPEEKARHSLAQAIYSLHRTLDAEVLESSATEVRLADRLIGSDVGDFLAANSRGDADAMAALYGGPLLDGFILSNAAEFDAWATAERARLERLALEAIERAALAADAAGASSERLWRRLTDLDPMVTRYAIGLARALARSSDSGTALRHLREHTRLLRTEMSLPAPTELQQLMAEITRRGPAGPVESPPDPPAGEVAAPLASSRFGERPAGATAPPAPSRPDERPVAASPAPPPRRAWARWLAIGGVGGALVVALLLWNARRPVRPLSGGAMVVLADVENLTADSTLGRALRVALEVGLGQSATFSLYPRSDLPASLARMGRSIADTVLAEPLAREIAVRETGRAVIVVAVSEIGGRYTVSSRIVDPPSGRDLAARRVSAERADDLLESVDRITAWTRRRLGDERWESGARLPLVTTPSLAALGAFADGGAAYGRSDWAVAQRFLARAIELDTGFAMARALVGEIHLVNNRIPEALAALREAERRSVRLTEPEQLNLQAMLARAEGRTEALIASAGALAAKYPSGGSWRLYGEALRSARRFDEAVAAFRRALAIDSTDVVAAHALAIAHNGAGNYRDALDAYALVDRLDSTRLLRDFQNHQWGGTFVAIGDLAGAEQVFRRMLARPAPADRARGHRSLGYLAAYRGRLGEAVEHFRAGIPLQTPGSLSEYRDLVVLADLERTRGDARAADAALDRMVTIFRQVPVQAAAVMFGGHQLALAGRLGQARLLLDSLAARAALRPNAEQDQAALAILRAELALAAGRVVEAEAALARPRFDAYNVLGFTLRAELFERTGRLDSALAMARAANESRSFGLETQMDWTRSFAALARIAEAAGDSAAARGAWSALIEQWKDGDPDLAPLVTARAELERLQAGVRR